MIPIHRSLPALPAISLTPAVDIYEDFSRRFLHQRRLKLRASFPDGTQSEPFTYDLVDRDLLDAVVIVPHFRTVDGELCVVLRSAVRPPVYFRRPEASPIPEAATLGGLWEVPAGLVERTERSERGLREGAARELLEEVGADVTPDDLVPLGGSTFPCPGVIGERHFFFHVRISPERCTPPTEDGSVLERHARVIAVPLRCALDCLRSGGLEDGKTEVAIRRLVELDLR